VHLNRRNIVVGAGALGGVAFLPCVAESSDVSNKDGIRGNSHVNFERDFGAKGDGRTDNSAAWLRFNDYAKARSNNGYKVVLDVPPGTYLHDHHACFGFLTNIKWLHIRGEKAIVQNVYNPESYGPNFGWQLPFGHAAQSRFEQSGSALIESTHAGDTSIRLRRKHETGLFAVGEWVLVASLDIQYYGFPPNAERFDFVSITAIDAQGTLRLDRPLGYEHRDDFADGINMFKIGRARVWKLNSDSAIWDIDHEYEGLEIRPSLSRPLAYHSFTGRRIACRNCVIPGISPSVILSFSAEDCRITNWSEVDKLVGSVILKNVQHTANITLPSSSIDRVLIGNSTISGVLETGRAKYLEAGDCSIDVLSVGGSAPGHSKLVSFNNCEIRKYPYHLRIRKEADSYNVLDNDARFSNRTLRVSKSSQRLAYWAKTPGTVFSILTRDGRFSGDAGTGIIERVYEDGYDICFETTLPLDQIPAWASGHFIFKPVEVVSFRNCTGSENVERATRATLAGYSELEYFKIALPSSDVNGASDYLKGYTGYLTFIKINVLTATAKDSHSYLNASLNARTAQDMNDLGQIKVAIDLSKGGAREFSIGGVRSLYPTDSAELNGKEVPQTAKKDWLIDGLACRFAYGPPRGPKGDVPEPPLVEIEALFDVGLFGSPK
jgi:hypothetical protein